MSTTPEEDLDKIFDAMGKADVTLTINTFDGTLINFELDCQGEVEIIQIEETSEQRLHSILTEFFPQWRHAEWNYTFDWDHTLWAKIIGLEIDGKLAYDILKNRPVTYLEHPLEDLEKQFELRLDETYLATQGITELKRDEEL